MPSSCFHWLHFSDAVITVLTATMSCKVCGVLRCGIVAWCRVLDSRRDVAKTCEDMLRLGTTLIPRSATKCHEVPRSATRHRSHGSSCKAKWPNSSSSCRAAGHCSCFLQAARDDRDRWDRMRCVEQQYFQYCKMRSILNAPRSICDRSQVQQMSIVCQSSQFLSSESFPFRSWTFHYFPSP